ncbi:MAG: bifunctional methylenetetrahydrofolate dehydrogenase/methenyltetrahydrofolate cyclohydrolase FolD [Gammaproteobacteria bacterium]|nr:bifunctional methylenetetrahydrofolate dehydrogenase/methenyltetrahydrofolate cyclohydrolase FolD [Gammaproteobacteria bacterium]
MQRGAHIIDGKAVAARLRTKVAETVQALPYRPGLTVILVGEDPASTVYVRNKERAAHEVGFESNTIRLSVDTSQSVLLACIAQLNEDPSVDGILVQLPLPSHIDAGSIVRAIDPLKDVDGFHPENVAALALGTPRLIPCTPRGILLLLREAEVPLCGSRAIVLGRSNIVGRPVASLLLAADATVTIAHSQTRDIASECRRCEIVVAAVGRAEFVRGDWIAPGATVIDVGINRGADGGLVGDVAFGEAVSVAGAITPVPGGVGPMTIACLLENTVIAAAARRS